MQIRIHQLNSFLTLTRKPCAKVLHLHLGRFQCRHCTFTANLKKSINGHYKANHPDSLRHEESGLIKIFVPLKNQQVFPPPPPPQIRSGLVFMCFVDFIQTASSAALPDFFVSEYVTLIVVIFFTANQAL
jgi:hypothetical protein